MNSYYRSQFVTPPVVKDLLIINVLVFFTQQVLPASAKAWMMNTLALGFPWGIGEVFQLVSYMFMHANFSHLFFNMFALWMFGRTLEYRLGSSRFLTYYLICGIGAALLQLGVGYAEYHHALAAGSVSAMRLLGIPTVGASGAVFGLLLAFGVLYPNQIVALIFPPITLKAKWFVVLYGVLELLLGISGAQSGVAHFAHLGGMIWGFLLLWWWRRKGKIYF